jgi:hypothetical protein
MSIDPHPDSQVTLIVPTLQNADAQRLEKAILGLLDGTLTVTLVSTSAAHIRATVANSTRSYEVNLTTAGGSCECPDATHRERMVCKHQIAVALFSSRPPHPAPVPMHLVWTSGAVVCGASQPARQWRWPWPATVLERGDVCPACVATYQRGYNRAVEARKAEATARRNQGPFTPVAPGQGAVQAPNLKEKSVAA